MVVLTPVNTKLSEPTFVTCPVPEMTPETLTPFTVFIVILEAFPPDGAPLVNLFNNAL